MSNDFKPAFLHFSAFQSAAEKAADKEMWETGINEGGQFPAGSGQTIQIVGSEKPYKVVLTFEDVETTERQFDTKRHAEAFISRSTSEPAVRDTSRDDSPGRG